MKLKHYLFVGIAILISSASGLVRADGNPQRGAKIYEACAACHSLEPNLHLTGPSLAGIWGQKAASVADYPRYSDALKARDFVWNDVTLNAWVANPQSFVPGTYMSFRGIKDERARNDLIAFLHLALTPGGSKTVIAQGLITPDAARGEASDPLEKAGPEELVTSVRHCQNSFFVVTGDGKQHAFWERNLRLKVDSSADGPKAGSAVLLPAGMQGDRASLVFSGLSEIVRLIEEKC
jgi:cytochrome c